MSAGRISTFYSYKGGVGRSFALANVATLLARWGHRVLCIDWDLEAPGLDLYFDIKDSSRAGLLDLLTDMGSDGSLFWRDCVTREVCKQGIAGSLDLISAGDGPDHAGYLHKLEALDWDVLYSEHHLGERLETLREEWCAAYDFVLIDSRTGITDPGAVCTVQLPDSLFMVLTANRQSLNGIRDVASRAEQARNRLPFERRRLNIVPVLSRFDITQEYELANEWRTLLAGELQPFFGTWLNLRVTPDRALDLCCIPYVSKWSFGEKLAVLTETRRDPRSVSYGFENLASLLSLGFDRTDLFGESPDSYVELAKREAKRKMHDEDTSWSWSTGQTSSFAYDVFLSHSSELRPLAKKVSSLLEDMGRRVFLDVDIRPGDHFRAHIDDALAGAKYLVFLIGKSVGSRQEDELYTFFRQMAEERSARRLIPVLIGSVRPPGLPTILATMNILKTPSHDPERIAAMIATDLLRGEGGESFSESESFGSSEA